MHHLSKVCDVADWFDPEFLQVIREELQEPARFHRKQWEFAIIFLALKKYGMLKPDKLGLSLGGGNERVLYSIAKHIRQLTVTDLYDQNTDWDCARTDDPNLFIIQSKPFPVEDEKIRALRMDMRQLDFDDQSFDFCYSSCAIEHIGDYSDFLQHLNEAYRVLKEDGVYVFTTEFHFGDETIQDSHNFIFSGNYLNGLVAESNFSVEIKPIVNISDHQANRPFPSNVNNLCYGNLLYHEQLLIDTIPHLQLLRGKFPFTSISFILKKKRTKTKTDLEFSGLTESKKFLQAGIKNYREQLQQQISSLNPFSGMGKSPFFADHSEFFSQDHRKNEQSDTVFHTDYIWFGSGTRNFQILLVASTSEPYQNCVIQIRVHRFETLNSQNVESIYENILTLSGESFETVDFSIPTEDGYSYAILGKLVEGDCKVTDLTILSSAHPLAPKAVYFKKIQGEIDALGNL